MTAARRALRLSVGDVALTAAIVVWALAEAAAIDGGASRGWRVAFALATTLAMLARNRWPAVTLALAMAAFVADTVLDILPIEAVTPLQLLPLATYAMASHGSPRRPAGIVSVAAIAAPALLVSWLARHPAASAMDVVSLVVVQSVAAGAGWSVRRRREEAEQQAESLRAASLAGEDLVRAGVEEERARIARELRVIVARGLAAMDRALAGTGGAAADRLAAVAVEVQRRAADVMDELQRLLAVLPAGGTRILVPVSAGAAAAAARARGWCVELDAAPGAADAFPGATLAAGRVVEEVLAGAPPRGGARVHVRVVPDRDGLHVALEGQGPAPQALADPASSGSLRERVRLHGGRARIRRRGRWHVRVVLPGAGGLPDTWRTHAFGDIVVVGAAALIVVGDARAAGGAGPGLTAALEALLLVLPLALRRRAPVVAPLVVAAGLLALELGGVLPRSRAPVIAALLATGAAAMHIPGPRRAIAVTVAVTASAVVVNLLQLPPGEPYTDTPILLFLAGMAFGFGRLVRGTMDRTAGDRAGAELVVAEQARALQDAVAAERRAVARDLHDVVAHGVSLVGVLAGGAAAQARSDPGRARASLSAAGDAVAQARAEVERLAAALGDEPGAATPSLADVDALVAAARRGGQPVRCEIDADRVAVPDRVAASAYRIVQEALTNARKHAPGAEVTVRVAASPRSVDVDVVNAAGPDARGGGTRRGIAGMGERVRLLGGELEVGPRAGGGFAVRARLPLDAAQATAPSGSIAAGVSSGQR